MDKTTQHSLFSTDPQQDLVDRLRRRIQRLEAENEALRDQIKRQPNIIGGEMTLSSHRVEPEGLYLYLVGLGQSVTVFIERAEAEDYGWIDPIE